MCCVVMCGRLSVMNGNSVFSLFWLVWILEREGGADIVIFVWFWDRYDVG